MTSPFWTRAVSFSRSYLTPLCYVGRDGHTLRIVPKLIFFSQNHQPSLWMVSTLDKTCIDWSTPFFWRMLRIVQRTCYRFHEIKKRHAPQHPWDNICTPRLRLRTWCKVPDVKWTRLHPTVLLPPDWNCLLLRRKQVKRVSRSTSTSPTARWMKSSPTCPAALRRTAASWRARRESAACCGRSWSAGSWPVSSSTSPPTKSKGQRKRNPSTPNPETLLTEAFRLFLRRHCLRADCCS